MYRLSLDEAGHNVEHIDFVSRLGKGASDTDLARYSTETDRTIVTYDDDFIEEVPPDRYRAVLFFEDDTVSAREIAAIIDVMAEVYPHEQVYGLQKTGLEWL